MSRTLLNLRSSLDVQSSINGSPVLAAIDIYPSIGAVDHDRHIPRSKLLNGHMHHRLVV